MACGCSSLGNDGKAVADLVRGKGFSEMKTKVAHNIECECGKTFTMDKLVSKCPNCNMTFAVTPCSSDKFENIKKCGINY